jgi:hypothetical protein
MNRLDKTYSFHISTQETEAIKTLRRHDINVSRFIRSELRRFADQLRSQNKRNKNQVKGGIAI